jgi:predicted metal-dependent peptidase
MTPNKMNVKQKIDRAMVVIANHHDGFAAAACAMPWIESSKVQTACTNGERVLYNAAFVDSLSLPMTVGLIIHEVMHPLLGHLERSVGMDHHKANVAFDYEINNMLAAYNKTASHPIILPKEALVDFDKYKNEAGEVIYRKLEQEDGEQEPEDDGDKSDDSGDKSDDSSESDDSGESDGDSKSDDSGESDGDGDSKSDGGGDKPDDKPQPSSSGEFERPTNQQKAREVTDRWREILSSAIQTARLRGTGGGDFLQKLAEVMEPPVALREVLEKFVCEASMSDESTRPDKTYMANNDMFVTGMESERHGTIVFVKDTSGSITDSILKQVCAVIQDSCDTLRASRLVVMDVDDKVCDVQEYAPNEDIPLTAKGRGGTDFCPAFEWVEENAPDARVIIYLTDGWGSFPTDEPAIPTVWISWDMPESSYPFGQVLKLDDALNSTI